MAKKRKFLSIIVALTMLFGFTMQVYAIPRGSNGYYLSTVFIRNHLPAAYNTHLISAVSAWNDANISPRRVTVNTTSSSGIWATYFPTSSNPSIAGLPAGSLGVHIPILRNAALTCRCHPTVIFQIHLNTARLSIPTPPGSGIGTNTIRSVIAHEIGHALGLADNGNGTQYLMSHTRNREVVLRPTAAEATAVRNAWCQ